jgi:hypothetical protein
MLANIMSCIKGALTKLYCLVTQVKEMELGPGAANQNLVNLIMELKLKIQNRDSRLEFLEAQVQSITDVTSITD